MPDKAQAVQFLRIHVRRGACRRLVASIWFTTRAACVSATKSTWGKIPGFDPVKEQYVQLDPKQWLKDQKIKEEGEDRGRKNLPAAEDDTLDEFESEIVDWVNRRGRVCRQDVSGHLGDLELEIAGMDDDAGLTILENRVGELRQEAGIALEKGIDAGRNRLTEHEAEVVTGSAEFERFRKRHKLTRLVDYSHRGKALWYIFGCFFAEIVLNASLLMDVNPFGLVGSTMQMALISLVNVVFLGLVMGVLLRLRNHVAASAKTVAWLGIVPVVSLVLCFNLAVGHYRNSMQATLDDHSADILAMGNDVLQRLVDSPFDLASFQTALLVLLGVMCFGIGAWKWYQRDDAYPGYGRLERELKGKKDAYKEAYHREEETLGGIHEGFQEELRDMLHKLVVKQSKWKETCQRGDKIVEDYPTNLGQYQFDLNYLLAAYRTANVDARRTPPPPHFAADVPVDEAILHPPSFSPPQETSLSGVAEKVNGAVTALQDEYRAARRQYETLEALTKRGLEEARATPA